MNNSSSITPFYAASANLWQTAYQNPIVSQATPLSTASTSDKAYKKASRIAERVNTSVVRYNLLVAHNQSQSTLEEAASMLSGVIAEAEQKLQKVKKIGYKTECTQMQKQCQNLSRTLSAMQRQQRYYEIQPHENAGWGGWETATRIWHGVKNMFLSFHEAIQFPQVAVTAFVSDLYSQKDGQSEQAITNLEDPYDTARTYLRLTSGEVLAGRLGRANALLDRVTSLNVTSIFSLPDYLIVKGLFVFIESGIDNAEPYFNEARVKGVDVDHKLIRYFLAINRPDLGLSYYKMRGQAVGYKFHLAYARTLFFLCSREFVRGYHAMKETIETDKNPAPILMELLGFIAEIQKKVGSHDAAWYRNYLQNKIEHLELFKNDPNSIFVIGALHFFLDEKEEAVTYLQKAAKSNPLYAPFLKPFAELQVHSPDRYENDLYDSLAEVEENLAIARNENLVIMALYYLSTTAAHFLGNTANVSSEVHTFFTIVAESVHPPTAKPWLPLLFWPLALCGALSGILSGAFLYDRHQSQIIIQRKASKVALEKKIRQAAINIAKAYNETKETKALPRQKPVPQEPLVQDPLREKYARFESTIKKCIERSRFGLEVLGSLERDATFRVIVECSSIKYWDDLQAYTHRYAEVLNEVFGDVRCESLKNEKRLIFTMPSNSETQVTDAAIEKARQQIGEIEHELLAKKLPEERRSQHKRAASLNEIKQVHPPAVLPPPPTALSTPLPVAQIEAPLLTPRPDKKEATVPQTVEIGNRAVGNRSPESIRRDILHAEEADSQKIEELGGIIDQLFATQSLFAQRFLLVHFLEIYQELAVLQLRSEEVKNAQKMRNALAHYLGSIQDDEVVVLLKKIREKKEYYHQPYRVDDASITRYCLDIQITTYIDFLFEKVYPLEMEQGPVDEKLTFETIDLYCSAFTELIDEPCSEQLEVAHKYGVVLALRELLQRRHMSRETKRIIENEMKKKLGPSWAYRIYDPEAKAFVETNILTDVGNRLAHAKGRVELLSSEMPALTTGMAGFQEIIKKVCESQRAISL